MPWNSCSARKRARQTTRFEIQNGILDIGELFALFGLQGVVAALVHDIGSS